MDNQMPMIPPIQTVQPTCANCGNLLPRAFAKSAAQDGVLLCHRCSTHSAASDINTQRQADKLVPMPDTFSPYVIEVVVSAMNVRTGPSKTYPVAEILHSGMQVSIIEERIEQGTPESKERTKWGRINKEEPRWIDLKYVRRAR